MESIYHDAAKGVLDGQVTTARQAFDKLKSIYVSDDKFEVDFAQKSIASGRRKRIAKYVLCRLESDASGRPCHFETDPGSVEHVLPENQTDGWDSSISRADWPDYTYRLGNLTLLSASDNREVGSLEYPAKKPIYERSGYKLTKDLVDRAPEDWTVPLIEDRQRRLAQRAVQVWRSDYS